MTDYDVAIVGAGPAGLTAAIYCVRYKLDVLVLGNIVGGMAAEAYEICNFPTYPKITGFEFAQRLHKHVLDLGVEVMHEQVTDIKAKGTNIKAQANFEINTARESIQAKKIILATGTQKRKLGMKNEERLIGRGISYCATCDAAFYKGKVVGVVGGGDAALTAALLLSEIAKKVYIFYRRDHFFRAEPSWVDLVEKNSKIETLFSVNITELIGARVLEGIKLDNNKKIDLEGLFVEIGTIPENELAKKLGIKLVNGYIETDKYQRTNIKGVFAAGDITNNALKQIVVACGEGAIAAHTAYKEIIAEGNR